MWARVLQPNMTHLFSSEAAESNLGTPHPAVGPSSCAKSSHRLKPTPIPHVESMNSQSAGRTPPPVQPPAQFAKAISNPTKETTAETSNHTAPISKVVPFRWALAKASVQRYKK